MENNTLPKVLSISLSTWRNDSGIHTQTDLFKFWQRDRLAQIYTKSDAPNTPVCNKFFQISENAVIHSVFNRKPVGRRIENGGSVNEKALSAEQKLYKMAHKKKSWFMTLLREVVWSLGRWKTKALDDFVKDFDADVYFVPVYSVIYMAKIQRYIIKKFKKPYVCYLSDDNYTYKVCGKNIFAYIHRFFLRKEVKFLAKNCSGMFTITKIQAKETDRTFGTKSVVLTKGINYDDLIFDETLPHAPVKMVYTGNLLIGRGQSLAEISKALGNINKEKTVATFDIYSPTILDKKTMALFNSNGCRFCGAVPKEEVKAIQNSADVVVFAESLGKKHRYDARLSFSTKLTDYFASGKCIFAIGDEKIAPIIYLKENDAAITATNVFDIEKQLRYLLTTKGVIKEYGKKAFDCGKRNHEEAIIKKTFIDTILKAAEKEN